MIYCFGPTMGQTVVHDGVAWTLTDVVEVDFTGADKFTPREPHAPVEAPDGREGTMYWAPILYPDLDEFDIARNIQGVITLDD